jgi:hypothetical protein
MRLPFVEYIVMNMTIARQRFSKHVPVATDTKRITEEL